MLDLIFFGAVSPNAHAAVIIPAFLLVIATLWLLMRLAVDYLGALIPLSQGVRKKIIAVSVICLGFVIALQSVGQLTARDLAALLPLLIVVVFYLSYTRSSLKG